MADGSCVHARDDLRVLTRVHVVLPGSILVELERDVDRRFAEVLDLKGARTLLVDRDESRRRKHLLTQLGRDRDDSREAWFAVVSNAKSSSSWALVCAGSYTTRNNEGEHYQYYTNEFRHQPLVIAPTGAAAMGSLRLFQVVPRMLST